MTRPLPFNTSARTLCLLACGLALNMAANGIDSPPDEKTAAQRGEEALLTRCFSPSVVSRQGYDSLWQTWGLTAKPADFDRAVRERYGLHPAPYPNDGLPMGLRPKPRGQVGIDCMLCHGGSLFGRSVVGLPNTSLDLAALFQDFTAARGLPQLRPYRLSNVRGTTEATATAIFLIAFRDPELNVRFPLGLGRVPDQMCEDAPALWLLKKKTTMYHTGRLDARAVRPLMSFMMSPRTSGAQFKKLEPTFADVRAFLMTLEPPKYPFLIDAALAQQGKVVFEENCVRCHGSYGTGGSYPNKIVPLEKIGTDPTLVHSLIASKSEESYQQSWFAQGPGPEGKPYPIRSSNGYQAPPLDGIWATAPYFHNGSVPTLHQVLNSKDRPRIFTRSYRTEKNDYDAVGVGWKTVPLENAPALGTPAAEQRRVYDTTQPGRSNAGHTFGDQLTEDERMAVIEYLKTL
jgi:mono/diheme cytochrome c family protein